MKLKQQAIPLLTVIALSISGVAQAALIDRGNGLIYDDVLDVTWLQDANYARTSGYDADGLMSWTAANIWAANLSYEGYDDWRLPALTDTGGPGCDFSNNGTDCGYNVDTAFSELAYMYHNNLGLTSQLSTSGAVQADYGIFGNGTYNGTDLSSFSENDFVLVQNLQSYAYWFAPPYTPSPSNAWAFITGIGYQFSGNQTNGFYAWAVRTGDVSIPNTVPLPAPIPLWLIGSGLVTLLGWRSKR